MFSLLALRRNQFSHFILFQKFSDAGIQDSSTSILITVKFEEMSDEDDDDDESDKHLEARDRRYSCLILENDCS